MREYGGYTDEPGRPEGLIYQPFAMYVRDRATVVRPSALTAPIVW